MAEKTATNQQENIFPFVASEIRPDWHGPGAQSAKDEKKSQLFSPLKIREVTFKNRIGVSPMCMYSAKDGHFNDWHMVHYGSFAKGGAGLIILEATAVAPEGRISPYCTGLWSDAHMEGLKPIVKFAHQMKSAIGIQLAHAGRKASTNAPFKPSPKEGVPAEEGGWTPVGPSALKWGEGYLMPEELTKDQIKKLIQNHVDATIRADKLGFDVIEIHGAHGYLISSFNSPISNKRTDEYGGDFEGRTRYCIEVVEATRKVWPSHKPLFIRLSCVDWVEGGWTLEETVKLSKILKEKGVDVIDCSSGGNSPLQKINAGPSFQVPFSVEVKKSANIPTAAVGMITKPEQAEAIIANGEADFVLMAREFLRDPHWPLRAAKALGADVDYCLQYER